MMLRWSSLVVAAALVAGPALAQQPEVPKPQAAEKDKKVCRRMEETGSIMSRKTCTTKAQWAQYDAQNAQNAEATRRQRQGSTGL